MSSRTLSVSDLARLTELAKDWGKIVVRRAFGDQGPGLDVDLTQMEALAQAVARGLIQGTLEQATTQQAQQMADQQPCPACGRLCPVRSHERAVVVQGATFNHHEPLCHCPDCRRDFFPSASLVETGHARLQPDDAAPNRGGQC